MIYLYMKKDNLTKVVVEPYSFLRTNNLRLLIIYKIKAIVKQQFKLQPAWLDTESTIVQISSLQTW